MPAAYATKFVSEDETWEYIFPLRRYEYEPSQSVRSPRSSASGAHFAYRHRGTQPVLLDAAQERIRAVLIEQDGSMQTEIDSMRGALHLAAYGKLYLSNNRWAWAEISSMPDVSVSFDNKNIVTVVIGFTRFGTWQGDEVTETVALTESPKSFDITLEGNAEVYDAVMTLSGTFTNPALSNSNTGYSWSSTRDGTAATSRLRVDAGQHTVEHSTNAGSAYTDDYAAFTRGTAQVQIMKYNPGINSLVYTDGGTPNGTISITYRPRWY